MNALHADDLRRLTARELDTVARNVSADAAAVAQEIARRRDAARRQQVEDARWNRLGATHVDPAERRQRYRNGGRQLATPIGPIDRKPTTPPKPKPAPPKPRPVKRPAPQRHGTASLPRTPIRMGTQIAFEQTADGQRTQTIECRCGHVYTRPFMPGRIPGTCEACT